VNFAIIGMGPTGLCILETLIRNLRSDALKSSDVKAPIIIHVIDSNQAGVGVHRPDQPNYLLLNTICGQLDSFASRALPGGDLAAGLTFHEWLANGNYRIDAEGGINVGGSGRAVEPDDFLPRSVFGHYLAWTYQTLADNSGPGIEIQLHSTEAVAIRRHEGAQELIETADGRQIAAHHVFLATGHTPNRRPHGTPDFIAPYPVRETLSTVSPGSEIAVAGFGLAAIDVVTALTTGRGGRFVSDPATDRLRYHPSGEEPRINLYSRSGLPFFCRPVKTEDSTGQYRPKLFTTTTVNLLRQTRLHRTGDRKLDFRADVFPLLFAEMTILFYSRHAEMAEGVPAEDVANNLAAGWHAGELSDRLVPYRERYGPFDPERLLFGTPQRRFADADDYQQMCCALLRRDFVESKKGEQFSPLKAAVELLRVLRDTIREVVEFGGLTAESQADFSSVIASMITRVVAGPPLRRGIELLALIDAGIVRLPFGPAPTIQRALEGGGWIINSTALEKPLCKAVTAVVAGYLDVPALHRSESRLLRNLVTDGRIRSPGEDPAGPGIDIDRKGHPVNRRGEPETTITVMGPLTEGSRYFTFVAPSPKSRFRAFQDADAAVAALVARDRADAAAPYAS
jgi:uncharacterized NAD(P)/FAD-binding protein YdhS